MGSCAARDLATSWVRRSRNGLAPLTGYDGSNMLTCHVDLRFNKHERNSIVHRISSEKVG